jgi:hypothetical protein
VKWRQGFQFLRRGEIGDSKNFFKKAEDVDTETEEDADAVRHQQMFANMLRRFFANQSYKSPSSAYFTRRTSERVPMQNDADASSPTIIENENPILIPDWFRALDII